MTDPLPRTLFVGRGNGAVCWYRCVLPATALGADWVGVVGEPGRLGVLAHDLATTVTEEDFADYDVVVLQQPRGEGWVRRIQELQAAGVTVLYEVDDYLHAIPDAADHGFRELFGPEQLTELELAMRASDGLVCSTDFIARRYRAFNPTVFVCRNGIDAKRYALTRPERDGVTIGWAGATGHEHAVRPWLKAVANVMALRPHVRFVSIGQGFADLLQEEFGEERCVSLPFQALETYPSAMTLIDVAIAPSGRSEFFRGKSDLRWLEAGALGIPVVGDPWLYPELEHGRTGFHAGTSRQAAQRLLTLVSDERLRRRVGAAAREHVLRSRTIEAMAPQWAEVLRSVRAGSAAAV